MTGNVSFLNNGRIGASCLRVDPAFIQTIEQVVDEQCENYLATAVSEKILELKPLLRRIEAIVRGEGQQGGKRDPRKQAILAHYITNLEGSLSADSIIERLQQITLPRPTLTMLAYRLIMHLKQLKARLRRIG